MDNKIDREEKISEYTAVITECYEEIYDSLDDNQKEIFEKYVNNFLDYSKICTEEAYEIGFEKGYKIAKESTFDIIKTTLDVLKTR